MLLHRLYDQLFRCPVGRRAESPPNDRGLTQLPEALVVPRPRRPTSTAARLNDLTDERAVAITEALLPGHIRERLNKYRSEGVTIVSDGPLHRLPFQALPVGINGHDGRRYLIDDEMGSQELVSRVVPIW